MGPDHRRLLWPDDRSQLIGLIAPEAVARQALERLGDRPVLITGWVSRFLVALLRALPRRLAVQLAGKGIKRALERSAHSRQQPAGS